MTIFLVTNETHGFTQCLHDLAISPTLRYTPGNCRMFLSCACWDRENTGHFCWQETSCLQSFPTSVNLFMFFSFLFFMSMISVSFLPSLLSRLNSFFFYSFRILYIFQCMFYCISIGIAIFPELSILVSMEIQQRERKRRTEKKD